MFQSSGGQGGGGQGGRGGGGAGGGQMAKLMISNLDYGVSTDDIKVRVECQKLYMDVIGIKHKD